MVSIVYTKILQPLFRGKEAYYLGFHHVQDLLESQLHRSPQWHLDHRQILVCQETRQCRRHQHFPWVRSVLSGRRIPCGRRRRASPPPRHPRHPRPAPDHPDHRLSRLIRPLPDSLRHLHLPHLLPYLQYKHVINITRTINPFTANPANTKHLWTTMIVKMIRYIVYIYICMFSGGTAINL